MAAFPCCTGVSVEAGSAALRVDWPVYPRRAEHNTVAEGGNRGSHHRGLKPDQALAVPVGLGLVAHAAERERPGNRLERLALPAGAAWVVDARICLAEPCNPVPFVPYQYSIKPAQGGPPLRKESGVFHISSGR